MSDPWPLENRKQMMRDVVRMFVSKGLLDLNHAPAFADTYGVLESEVTAEMMKHLSEGEGK